MVALLLTQIALCLISRVMNHRMPLLSDVVMPCLLSVQTLQSLMIISLGRPNAAICKQTRRYLLHQQSRR